MLFVLENLQNHDLEMWSLLCTVYIYYIYFFSFINTYYDHKYIAIALYKGKKNTANNEVIRSVLADSSLYILYLDAITYIELDTGAEDITTKDTA